MISSDVAFTPTVKAIQTARGSRATYARMEAGGGWRATITDDLRGFLGEVTTAFLGTATADGQPYIQHRGGPPGFLVPLDDETIGFADYRGNRQYISTGNLAENPKAYLFLIDYAHKRRVKLWGRARVVEDDPALVARLMPAGYNAKPEQAMLFTVTAWDTNCPQHIPQLLPADAVSAALAERDHRIAELEAEIARLKG